MAVFFPDSLLEGIRYYFVVITKIHPRFNRGSLQLEIAPDRYEEGSRLR
jgi:hypothetical protein